MTTIARTLVLIAAGALAGCVSYQPKPGEATSRVRIVTFTGDTSSITVLDPKACPERKRLVYQQISGLLPREQGTLGMPGAPEAGYSDFKEMVIPANQPLMMLVGSLRGASQYVAGYSCYVGLEFPVQPATDYEVQYRYDGKGCNVRAYRLRAGAGGAATRESIPGVRQIPNAKAGTSLCR